MSIFFCLFWATSGILDGENKYILSICGMISRIVGTNIVSAYTPIAEMEERIIIILQADNGIACIAQSVQFVDLCE